MAYYVTPNEVQEIYIDCPLTDDQIDPYISSAHLLICEVLVGKGYSESKLKDIEKYLTAHLISSINYRPTSREKVGEAEVEFTNTKFGEGLKSTPFGHVACMLDTSGTLSKMGKREASFIVPKSFDE